MHVGITSYLLQITNEQEILNQTYTMASQKIFDESYCTSNKFKLNNLAVWIKGQD